MARNPWPKVLALWLALAVDRAFGEPPDRMHPVARFGSAMEYLESRVWADRRDTGGIYAIGGVTIAAAVGAAAARIGGRRPAGRALAVAVATYVAVASRALNDTAGSVGAEIGQGDLAAARTRLRGLVGRDTTGLDEAEVIRAVVESVAENTVDAVTAPLLWAALAGAPGVLAYRAVNTLDAMVGHRSDRYARFGWASARGDDLANWLPARATAAAVAAARPRRARAVWRAVRDQAPGHPSPNAGVIEAAFAAALGISLGGTNDYGGRIEVRPVLGRGPDAGRHHIAEACRLSRQATLIVTAVVSLGCLVSAGRWSGT